MTAAKNSLKQIKKRDGSVVPFDQSRIVIAVQKAMRASGEGDEGVAVKLATAVTRDLEKQMKKAGREYVPAVEEAQDLVEKQLIAHNLAAVAKAYILYRQRRTELRQEKGEVPKEVRELSAKSKQYFRNQLSEFVYHTTYSKWIPEKRRRETWVETVERYMSFMRENLGNKLKESEYAEIQQSILEMKALGSMRLLWSAGSAARKTNVAAYNCSFTAPSKWQDFAEVMYILMCGTGVGFSVEHQTVEMLPMIKRQTGKKISTFTIPDSKEGWCDAFSLGLETWSSGQDIEFDYSAIRPQGSRLVTMGGRASGPAPLRALLDFSREKMLARQGRRLSTLDVHDILCKTGEVVVMGGVRRSALISLSDVDDQDMREAKNGQFYLNQPQRSMANNSAVYNEKPTVPQFLDEWVNLVKSGSGERGVFNRGSLKQQLPDRRWKVFEKDAWSSGTNPCGEIILKSKQFCNLSEVVARAEDTEATLVKKVRVATILGTYQATLTKFPYLSKEWKKNCEEEALLGVSITGQFDSKVVRNPDVLRKLKEVAIETNREYASRFGINPSTCITCVKPSGNGSQLFDSSSGMHPRHAPYYIRRIRIENHNPLFHMLRDLGVPHQPEVGQTHETATTYVLEFPVKAPKGSVYKDEISALAQLEHWKMLKENFTEHNPSTTISVGEDEWLQVGNWVYHHWDIVGGLSFLPRSEHVYRLAPYEAITEEHYTKLVKSFPQIDFSKVVLYEYDDETSGSKELACVAGTCEIDLTPKEKVV
ncbi:ribonucleoside-triphosphate reductase [Candidatus Nomurabacteria bacterium]|nr:ribonucleoside-triphosphate reductase [Candidatus Nomurabacteria bacterium]